MKSNDQNTYLLKLQASRLKECLRESGLKQKKIAEKLNYTEQHISHVFNGKRKLTKELAIELADLLSTQHQKCIPVSIPYNELSADQQKDIDMSDIDENGNVTIIFDYPIKINYSYLLGESDLKNSEEQFDPPLAKNPDYLFQKGICSILKRNHYALCCENYIGISGSMIEKSVFHKDCAVNSFLCSSISKKNEEIKIVNTATGETYILSILELSAFFNSCEQLLLSMTDQLFNKLRVEHALSTPPNDTAKSSPN